MYTFWRRTLLYSTFNKQIDKYIYLQWFSRGEKFSDFTQKRNYPGTNSCQPGTLIFEQIASSNEDLKSCGWGFRVFKIPRNEVAIYGFRKTLKTCEFG